VTWMDPRGEIHRLGRRHIPRHAPCRAPAVDQQEEHVERLLSQLLGQPVIRQAVSTIIQPEPLGLDDVLQVRITAPLITVDPLVCRRDARTRNPARSTTLPASVPEQRWEADRLPWRGPSSFPAARGA